jgi:uncharacterized protein YjbJ (UPF0337 family)
MGTDDKLANKAQDMSGRAKEAAGSLAGDRQLQDEGKADQVKAAVKDAGEHLKDAAKDAGGHVKDAAHKLKDAVTKH